MNKEGFTQPIRTRNELPPYSTGGVYKSNSSDQGKIKKGKWRGKNYESTSDHTRNK